MTLGDKIRQARKQCCLSQEQLAEKMCVSRSAIAKWETDKGMPDIENLKVLSRLLHVSVDALLDDSKTVDDAVLREPFNLALYGRGCKKVKKDRFIREKYPDAKIVTLLSQQTLTAGEKVLDNASGFVSSAPFGIPDMINRVKHLNKEFYLIEKEDLQFFAVVTDEFLELRRMDPPVSNTEFKLGNWSFIRCTYEVE